MKSSANRNVIVDALINVDLHRYYHRYQAATRPCRPPLGSGPPTHPLSERGRPDTRLPGPVMIARPPLPRPAHIADPNAHRGIRGHGAARAAAARNGPTIPPPRPLSSGYTPRARQARDSYHILLLGAK